MLGTTIHAHYKIIKFLGMGRSGSTYLAENLDLPDRPPCLVKKFQCPDDPGMADPLIGKLFEAQASILQKVGQHPQIPTLIAKFEEDGSRYLVSEYINGDLLSDELPIGSIWSQTQVFDFLMDLVDILKYVHSFKYIHQDINPKNIIRRKNDGRFMAIGFSAVKDLGSVWHQISKHDPRYVNISIGTPGYVPYEQEQNQSQFNSDLYAVGVIAIQALIGEFPILKDAHTHELKWHDGIKIDLRLMNIIDKMVRPDYRNRYQSAAEVLKDLQAFALTQIPQSKFDRLKPHLIFGAITCTLLLSFSAVKLRSTSTNLPSPPKPVKVATRNVKPAIMTSQTGLQTYVDLPGKFKIKYPPTWRVENIHNLATGEAVAFVSPKQSATDKYQGNVSIRVKQLSNPQPTLAEYTKTTIAEIKKSAPDLKMIESTSMVMGKKSVTPLIYNRIDKNTQSIENLQVLTIDRGRAYIITYKADRQQYYNSLQTVTKMINSFEVN
jgi:eukaryotic-like serine/threonine-protein kinase